MKAKVIPLAIGALGTTPIKLRNWLKEKGIETQVTELKKTVLLHTFFFLFFILRPCKFLIYKFTNSTMNLLHALIKIDGC